VSEPALVSRGEDSVRRPNGPLFPQPPVAAPEPEEVPVEQLIGWTCSGVGWDANGVNRAQAEVDDLAAWLNDHVSWAGWQIYHDVERYCVDVDNFGGEAVQQFFAPTIRDALIAAVRKVADQP